MDYKELIDELYFVINKSEINTKKILDEAQNIENTIASLNTNNQEKEKISSKLNEIFSLLQNQDLHRQIIEKTINCLCEKNNIDKTQYNIAPSAKNIAQNKEATLNQDELEDLIKQMESF